MANLTLESIHRLIQKMRAMYGNKFDQQWKNVEPSELSETFLECLDGLSVEELQAGVKRMMREAWPPTIPEFRQWCEQGGLWLTANEAWAMATSYLSDPDSEITVQAKDALHSVRHIINNEGQQAASRAFRDVYSRLVQSDKDAGVAQSIYKPKALPKPKPEPEPTPEQVAEAKANCQKYAAELRKILDGAA